MKRFRPRGGAISAAVFASLCVIVPSPSARSQDAASDAVFETLQRTLPRIDFESQQYWLAEGDVRLTEEELHAYAETRAEQLERYRFAKRRTRTREVNVMPRLLIQTNPLTGDLIRWTPGANLRYCVLRSSFSSPLAYALVVSEMVAATSDWEETCNIRFEHVAAADNSLPGALPPPGVLFTVRGFPLSGGVIASAFFPQEGPDRRHLLVGPSYFSTSFNRVGVLRHELGHVLGFRHEHIRSEAPPACFSGELPDANTLPLTEYNPTSVMHYFCGGVGDINLAISSLDRVGARIVYPFSLVSGGLAEPVVVNAAEVPAAADLEFENVDAAASAAPGN